MTEVLEDTGALSPRGRRGGAPRPRDPRVV